MKKKGNDAPRGGKGGKRHDFPHVGTPERQALARFEEAAGGREKVVETLQHGTLLPDQEYLVGLIADPRNDRKSLATIARMANIRFGQLMKFFQEAGFAQAQMQAFQKVWKGLPEVAGDVMAKAIPREVECPACHGDKVVTITQVVGKGKDKKSEEVTKPCWNCREKGVVTIQPELDTQKIALQLGRLITPGGVQVGVQVGVQQNGVGIFSADALKDFRSASDRLLFPGRQRGEEEGEEGEEGEVVEGEVVEEQEEQAEQEQDEVAPPVEDPLD